MLKVFEAFAGIGSQTIALKRLNIDHEVIAISEIDKFAIKSYEALNGKVNNLGDISKIQIEDVPDHDLFTYSFPCQDISTAGKQKGFEVNSGSRSGLLWECQKIIKAKKPKFLLMENVAAITHTKNKDNLRIFLKWLSDQGYRNYYKILNVKDYRIPQNRRRFFCVSIRKDVNIDFKFPDKQELKYSVKDFVDYKNTNRRFFRNEHKKYFNQLKESDLKFSELGLFRDTKFNKIIILCDMTEIFNIKLFGFGSKYIYSIKGISPTITTFAYENHFWELKGGLFSIESFKLMGFTEEEFKKCNKVNSDTQLIKQAGNSIVINVLEAIFKSLFIDSQYLNTRENGTNER